MPNEPAETALGGPLQEFDDRVVDDPSKLAALQKQLRRSPRQTPRLWWWVTAGAVLISLLTGLLVGRFFLAGW